MKFFIITFALGLHICISGLIWGGEKDSKSVRQAVDTSNWFSLRTELIPGETIEVAFPTPPEFVQSDSSIYLKATDPEGVTFVISTIQMRERDILAFGCKMANEIEDGLVCVYGLDAGMLYRGPVRENPTPYHGISDEYTEEEMEEEHVKSINLNTGYLLAWIDNQGTFTYLALFRGKNMVYALTCQCTLEKHHSREMFRFGSDISRKCIAFSSSFSIDLWK